MATKKKVAKKKGEKHAGGRPTKYSPAMVKKTQEYIDSCEDTIKEEVSRVDKDRLPIAYEMMLKVNIPTIEGLSLVLGVHKDTINEWDKEHKEFSVVIGELRSKQARMLVENGLSGRYNPTIAKVLLSKHGYKEATEVDEKVTHKIDISKMLERAYGDKEE